MFSSFDHSGQDYLERIGRISSPRGGSAPRERAGVCTALMRTCQEYLVDNKKLWLSVLDHPFLARCKDASISKDQFYAWLQQDYLYVVEFMRLLASTLLISPVEDFEQLIGGTVALKEELAWYREKAKERGIALIAPMHPACSNYKKLMQSLHAQPYAVQAAAVWAIEYAYNEAWSRASPMEPPYDEFAQRWGNNEFSAYVRALAGQADAALARVSEEERQTAEDACNAVAHAEVAFWQMAFEA